MRVIAVAAFFSGLLLAVRVMFFGLQKGAGDQLRHRRWPLALAAFLTAAGATLYAGPGRGDAVTSGWMVAVVTVGVAAGIGAWWLVKRSAELPFTDPDDDPRYRFQGHVARIVKAIEDRGAGGEETGRITFRFDGKTYELDARWSPDSGSFERELLGRADNEVVIERVEGDTAFVEPWAVVEERL